MRLSKNDAEKEEDVDPVEVITTDSEQEVVDICNIIEGSIDPARSKPYDYWQD